MNRALENKAKLKTDRLLGHGAMVLFAFLIAGAFFIGERAAPYVDPAALNAIRFTFAVLIVGGVTVLFFKMQKQSGEIVLMMMPIAPWRFLALGGLMAYYMLTMLIALQTTASLSTGAIFTLMPLLTALIGYLLLRQATSGLTLLSLFLAGFGALWVIFDGDIEVLMRFEWGRGEFVFLTGTFAHALYAPMVKRLNRNEPTLVFTFWTIAGAWFWLLLIGGPAIVKTDLLALPIVVWVAIAYLAVFTTAGTFFLMQFAVLRIPASKAASYIYLTPTFIILMEGIAGTGWVSISVMAGAGLTVAGLLMLNLTPENHTSIQE